MKKLLASLWITIATLLFVACLVPFVQTGNADYEVFLIYGMTLLTFPIGLPVAFLFAAAQSHLPASVSAGLPSAWSLTLFWLLMLIAGYVQWFVIVPTLIRRKA